MKAAGGSIFNFARNRSGSNNRNGSGSSNRTGSGRGSDKNNKSILTRISDFLTSGAERAASRQQSKKTHTEKVGESRSPKQMTKDAKKAQKKAAKEAGKGFKDSFKDTVRAVKSAGKTLVNATGINGKQKKEQAVGKIYGITRGIGTTIAHPIRTAKGIASDIKKKTKEKGESYVGGYILGEVTQTVAAAGAAAAAGKGLKGAKAVDKGGDIAKTLNAVRKPLAKNEGKQFAYREGRSKQKPETDDESCKEGAEESCKGGRKRLQRLV